LKDAGVTDKELRAAISELRQGQNVTSQSSEDTYQSLSKYAINLIEAARNGKLDPVIGRDEEIFLNTSRAGQPAGCPALHFYKENIRSAAAFLPFAAHGRYSTMKPAGNQHFFCIASKYAAATPT
jgi:hypothetical protein